MPTSFMVAAASTAILHHAMTLGMEARTWNKQKGPGSQPQHQIELVQ